MISWSIFVCLVVAFECYDAFKVVGGTNRYQSTSDHIYNTANYAVDDLNAMTNSIYWYKLAEILEAKTKVISVVDTYLTVELHSTNCLKSARKKSHKNCRVDPDTKMVCQLVVEEQPWSNKKQVKITSCSNEGSPDLSRIERMAEVLGISSHEKNLVHFSEFMSKFKRKYKSDKEMAYRFRIFCSNMKKADNFNKSEQGSATYGVTIFSDLTKVEFKEHLGVVYDPRKQPCELPKIAETSHVDNIPPEFDWRDHGVVTPVKDQGNCGSCWAFAVTANIESQYAIAHKELLTFSEQQIVDCDKLNHGCNGGYFNTAIQSIRSLGGLTLEQDYPYHAKDGKCHFKSSNIRVSVKDYVEIPNDEIEMAKYLVANGPISTTLNAGGMQHYIGGVSHPRRKKCDPDDLDHAVLIVGYGVQQYLNKTLPYWLIKNSWGDNWGLKGYYKLYRGDESCGLTQHPMSAILE